VTLENTGGIRQPRYEKLQTLRLRHWH